MRWPLVSRRRFEAVGADRERLRGERDQFAEDRDAYKAAAETAARQFESADEELTATRIVNGCLTEDLTAARKQLAAHAGADTVPRADYEAERKRADHLQQRLDQACGLNSAGVALGATWQDRREQKMRFDS